MLVDDLQLVRVLELFVREEEAAGRKAGPMRNILSVNFCLFVFFGGKGG